MVEAISEVKEKKEIGKYTQEKREKPAQVLKQTKKLARCSNFDEVFIRRGRPK